MVKKLPKGKGAHASIRILHIHFWINISCQIVATKRANLDHLQNGVDLIFQQTIVQTMRRHTIYRCVGRYIYWFILISCGCLTSSDFSGLQWASLIGPSWKNSETWETCPNRVFTPRTEYREVGPLAHPVRFNFGPRIWD